MPARIPIKIDDLILRGAPPSIQNMVGKVFGRLEVLKYVGYRVLPGGQFYNYVLCMCECGKEVIGNVTHIKHGKWSSCGCLRVDHPNRLKHGYAPLVGKREKIYVTWQSINKRCYNVKDKAYIRYGGRGVKVCSGWRGESGFENFKLDMSPITNKSIDRIETSGHYSCGHCDECIKNNWPFNCRWADDYIQSNNRGSFNNMVTIDGVPMTFRQADRHLGFRAKTIQSRVKTLGWSLEKAISTPVKSIKQK